MIGFDLTAEFLNEGKAVQILALQRRIFFQFAFERFVMAFRSRDFFASENLDKKIVIPRVLEDRAVAPFRDGFCVVEFKN